MQTITNIQTLILKRPNTVLEQYQESCNSTKEWLLVIDDDATITKKPNEEFESNYDFISFEWINAPAIYGRKHFGVGLYRISALRTALETKNLSSEGLDLTLAQIMKTEYSEEYSYYHDTKLTMKRFFRYGKGRAFFLRTCKPSTLPTIKNFNLKWIKYYFAYLIGFIYGSIVPVKDSHW